MNEFLKKKKSTASEVDENFVLVMGQSPIYSSLFKKSISKKKWSRGTEKKKVLEENTGKLTDKSPVFCSSRRPLKLTA